MTNYGFNNRPKRFGIGRFFGFALLFLVFAAAMGFIVMFLWNAILPAVTGVQPLNYWQAAGLLILCRILFGGHGGGRWGKGGHGPGNPYRERWMNMSDEERQKAREAWRNRCRPNE